MKKFRSFENGGFGKKNCYKLQKSIPKTWSDERSFPKSVHLHKNREWISLGE